MSRNQRLGLVAVAAAIAVVAFVVAKPGGDDEEQGAGPQSGGTPGQTETGTGGGDGQRTETTRTEPPVTRIAIRGGAVQGGVKRISVERGDAVRIVVTTDAPDELHLHGFDITREAAPGKPARFRFKADIEGEFELESHTAEHAGREPAVARVVVAPS